MRLERSKQSQGCTHSSCFFLQGLGWPLIFEKKMSVTLSQLVTHQAKACQLLCRTVHPSLFAVDPEKHQKVFFLFSVLQARYITSVFCFTQWITSLPRPESCSSQICYSIVIEENDKTIGLYSEIIFLCFCEPTSLILKSLITGQGFAFIFMFLNCTTKHKIHSSGGGGEMCRPKEHLYSSKNSRSTKVVNVKKRMKRVVQALLENQT